jgi:glycosyltransferase involved in cell wall biosynthesis
MKVLIVTNMYPSEGDVSWRGGFVKDQVLDTLDTAANKEDDVDIDIYHIKGPISGGGLKEYIKLWPGLLMKLIFGGYDVVHSHHSFCTLMCLPWFFRLIYTVHEGELNNTSWRSSLIKLAIAVSGVVVYVSHAEFMSSKKKQKFFLPCGIDLNLFVPSSGDKERYILFPADPSRPEKNASILKESAALKYSITGEQLNIVYGGNIPKEDMPSVMARASIVVSIGGFESDGMVLKETMACNVPAIATRVGNHAYYLQNGGGELVGVDASDVLHAIDRILLNPSSYLNGRSHLLEMNQDSSQVAGKLLKIYRARL